MLEPFKAGLLFVFYHWCTNILFQIYRFWIFLNVTSIYGDDIQKVWYRSLRSKKEKCHFQILWSAVVRDYIKITQQLWVELDQIHFSTEICWLIKVSKFVHILRSLHLHTHIIMLPQNASFHQLRNVSIVSFFRKNDLFFLFLLMIL